MRNIFTHRIAAVLGLAALCIAGSGLAQASLVNCSFEGTVDVGGVPAAFQPNIVDGNSVTGTFQYDTTTPADAGGNAGFSGFPGAITDFSFNVADGGFISTGFHRASGGQSNIQMYNNLGAPDYDHISLVPFTPELEVPTLSGFLLDFAVMRLQDDAENVFPTAATLPNFLQGSHFTSMSFFLFFEALDSEETASISMTITKLQTDSVTNSVVPEPATLSLIGMGIAGLGGAIRRRRADICA